MLLEAELAGRNIPFHKYGGLKFVETAHVKDLLAFLRLAENPRDVVAGTRLLPLLPGIGPDKARQLMDDAGRRRAGISPPGGAWKPPAGRRQALAAAGRAAGRPGRATEATCPPRSTACASSTRRCWRRTTTTPSPALARPGATGADRRALSQPAADAAGDGARPAHLDAGPGRPAALDDDYLVLSTIHSAKGLEWDAVYVIHAADGNIPSDMATGSRRGDRGRAAAVLRGPDPGEELALRLLPAALLPLPAGRERPLRLCPADAVSARRCWRASSSGPGPRRAGGRAVRRVPPGPIRRARAFAAAPRGCGRRGPASMPTQAWAWQPNP